MKKWSVWFTETNHYYAVVEADSKEEALDKALETDRVLLHCEQEPELDADVREFEKEDAGCLKQGPC